MKLLKTIKEHKQVSKHPSLYSLGLLALIFTVITACGQYYAIEEENQSNVADEEETEEVYELPYLETVEMGDCGPELGCMRGFISHGMELVISPDDSSLNLMKRENTEPLVPIRFRDAQDFGDRFDTAFLKPLVKKGELDLYDFKISPTVTRDNFAEGFEMYTEGLSAKDKSLSMGGEGNFILGDIIPYDKVDFRAVKMFRIEMSKYDAETDTDISNIICLEISAIIRDNLVEADTPVNLGGLSNFNFYYTEDSSYCSNKVMNSGTRAEASTLPATVPEIP
ncbi:MAG: hypothetical protein AB8G05_05575 [Oligoflexales bacterium]